MAFMKRQGIMLCYPAEQRRINAFPISNKETGERAFFHQPKLNGERIKTEWFGETPYFISSYGNEFKFLDKIRKELIALQAELKSQHSDGWPCKAKFDGEAYVHGWSRERIDSALRRTKTKNPEVDQLQYHIFDLAEEGKHQWERIRLLGLAEQAIQKLGLQLIKIVPYGVCNDKNWLIHCQCYIDEDYEGIILRNPFGQYVEKRSADVLKFKPTETDLYRIVGVNEAIDLQGQPKGMVGSFEVAADDEPGNEDTFSVGAGKLPHVERVRYWNMQDQIKGKMLLVKHELLETTNKVPIAAVAVAVME